MADNCKGSPARGTNKVEPIMKRFNYETVLVWICLIALGVLVIYHRQAFIALF